MPLYRVKENNHVQAGNNKTRNKRIYQPGETLTLSREEGEAIPWAVELVSERSEKKAEKN